MAVSAAPHYNESSFTEVVVACLEMLISGPNDLLLSWRLEKPPGEYESKRGLCTLCTTYLPGLSGLVQISPSTASRSGFVPPV